MPRCKHTIGATGRRRVGRELTGERRRLGDRLQRRPLCIMPVAFTRRARSGDRHKTKLQRSDCRALRAMRPYVKAKRVGRSGHEPQLPQVAFQHDAQASRGVGAWHGAPAPCQLTDATDLGARKSSGAGLPAVRARRLPVGRVPGTTALLDESTVYRTPQGCNVHLRVAHWLTLAEHWRCNSSVPAHSEAELCALTIPAMLANPKR